MKKAITISAVTFAAILVIALVFLLIPSSSTSGDKSPEEINYELALSLLSKGEYRKAFKVFTDLGEYKDSAKYISRFHYVPTKAICTSGEETGIAEITLNKNNLPEKETYTENGEVTHTNEYIYNDKGQCIKTISKSKDYSVSIADTDTLITNMVYDENGNVIKSTMTNADGITLSISEQVYNEKGQMIKSTLSAPEISAEYIINFEYTYDDNDNLIEEIERGPDYTSVIRYIYDESGNIVKDIKNDEEYDYFYDENGNLVKYVCPKVNIDDILTGELPDYYYDYYISMYSVIPQEYNITYDENGNISGLTINYVTERVCTFDIEFDFVYIPYDVNLSAKSTITSWVSSLSVKHITPTIMPDISIEGGVLGGEI